LNLQRIITQKNLNHSPNFECGEFSSVCILQPIYLYICFNVLLLVSVALTFSGGNLAVWVS